jgi:hypothetical protein
MEAASSSKTLVSSYQITNRHSIIPHKTLIFGLKQVSKRIHRPFNSTDTNHEGHYQNYTSRFNQRQKGRDNNDDDDDDNHNSKVEQCQNHSENI